MKKILILSFSPIKSDPRVMRQILALEKNHLLTVVGFGDKPNADVGFFDVSAPPSSIYEKVLKGLLLLFRKYELYYFNIKYVKKSFEAVKNHSFDLVVSNDINTLPLALLVAKDAPVFFDAHEYSPKEFEDRFFWRIFFSGLNDFLCKKYLHKATQITTVCKTISDEYKKVYGVESDIVLNAPKYENLRPSKINDQAIQIIHHGVAHTSRSIELMIQMMDYLDQRFTLDLMFVNDSSDYVNELKKMAINNPRIKFIKPVPMPEISKTINSYDIGLFLLPPVNFNYEVALPNKFFEFIQARLAIAIGPSPEMANLVNRYSLGVVASSFEPKALAEKLNALSTEDILNFKLASNNAAKEINAENEGKYLIAEIEKLMNR